MYYRIVYGCVIFCCILLYYLFFIHLPVDGHLGCFHVLAFVISAVMNNGVHVSFQIMFFSEYMPRSGIARSYDSSILSFLRNLHTLLHSGSNNLHSHQNSAEGFPSLHTLSSIYRSWIFWMIPILGGVRWYRIWLAFL